MALVQAEAALHAAHQAKPTFALGFMSRAYKLTNFGLRQRPSSCVACGSTAARDRERNLLSFCRACASCPWSRSGVFQRAGVDLKPTYEMHIVVHAISMITST